MLKSPATMIGSFLVSTNCVSAVSGSLELLAHIKEAFLEADRIWTGTLVDRLRNREESPWNDIRGKPLDGRMLADMLKPYRIKANNDVKIDGINRKGYRRSDFEHGMEKLPFRE